MYFLVHRNLEDPVAAIRVSVVKCIDGSKMIFLLTVAADVEPEDEQEHRAGVLGTFLLRDSKHHLQLPVFPPDDAT